MVGFIREPAKEEDSGASQPKLKTSTNESESYKFEFDSFSPDFDELSFASVQPFLDFDVIKDWVEEMQEPDRDEANKVNIGSELGVESCMQDPVIKCSVDFVLDTKEAEKCGPLTVEKSVHNRNEMGEDSSLGKPCGIQDCSMINLIKSESDKVQPADVCSDVHNHNGEIKVSHAEESVGVLIDENCGKLEILGCSIEEGLEKVSLAGSTATDGLVVSVNSVKESKIASIGDRDDSDSGSESESECETSSSSSSSSESSDDDDEEEVEEKKEEKSREIKSENTKQEVDIEEGEIMGSDLEKIVSSSDDDDECEENENYDGVDQEFEVGEGDDDDDDLAKGPIKSRNEVVVLPPVPPVNVTLQPCHQISPVGVVSSILGAQIIVEGAEKHSPLSEGSILWIAETRLPLGVVDEIFGPVKTPYYIVRYNSESEVPPGIGNGTLVGFVPDFVDHVLNDKTIYQKGYDASGENDEEVYDEAEFSDDEKEAEYRRMLKMSKRGNNNQGSENKKKNRRNIKNKERTWTKDQPTASQAPSPTAQPPQSNQMQHHVRAPVPPSSQVNPSGPPPNRPINPAGPTAFPQPAQPAGFMMNGMWPNAMPFQQQNMGFPSGFPMNGMPWLQQNPPQAQQMPSMTPAFLQQQQFFPQIPQTNSAPYQQPFDLSQLISGSSGLQLGPAGFGGGPTNSPWSGMLGPNLSNQAPQCLPGAGAQLPMYPGFAPNEPQQMGQSSYSQPATTFPANTGPRPQFNQGFSSGGGRGRGRKPFHQRGGGGGRFRGGRGRQ